MLSHQYIAGFLDGEGYFGIVRHKTDSCKRGYGYVSVIKVAQSVRNRTILDILHKELGGYLGKEREHTDNQSNSVMLEWKSNEKVKKILELVIPYLVVKKKQAETLLEFCKIKTPTTRVPGVVDEEMENMYLAKELLYKRIRELNTTGNTVAETKWVGHGNMDAIVRTT